MGHYGFFVAHVAAVIQQFAVAHVTAALCQHQRHLMFIYCSACLPADHVSDDARSDCGGDL